MSIADIRTCYEIIIEYWKMAKRYFEVPMQKRDDDYWTGFMNEIDSMYRKYEKTRWAEYLKEMLYALEGEIQRQDKEYAKNH